MFRATPDPNIVKYNIKLISYKIKFAIWHNLARAQVCESACARVRHLDTRPHRVPSPSLSRATDSTKPERDGSARRQTLSETLRGLFAAAILYVPFVDRY